MITPKEFELERQEYKSKRYEEALELVEKCSEKMRMWASDGRSLKNNWFKNDSSVEITGGYVDTFDLLKKDEVLRSIAFEEFSKNGWNFWMDKEKMYFKPKGPMKRKPNCFELILILFGYKPNLEIK